MPANSIQATIFEQAIEENVQAALSSIYSTEQIHESRDVVEPVVKQYFTDKLVGHWMKQDVWKAAEENITYFPAEPTTASVVQALKGLGCNVIAFTGKSAEAHDVAHRQLQDALVELNIDVLTSEKVEREPTGREHGFHFKDGIMTLKPSTADLSQRGQKGGPFIAFLKAINHTPQRVVFIDNYKHAVEDVVNACVSYGIDAIGIWYRGVDPQPRKFLTLQEKELFQEFHAHSDWWKINYDVDDLRLFVSKHLQD